MDFDSLTKLLRTSGIVGAGGAGFPAYAKLNPHADTIILNCAECEPLLKLHRQVLEKYSFEIMTMLTEISDAIGAEHIIIAIKKAYKEAVASVENNISSFPKVKIGFLPEIYPAGDEVVTIYETTGRVVKPGSIPISVGVIVYNVETIYNAYRAVHENAPVTHKYITVTGAVNKPVTLNVPLGMSYGEVISLAGGPSIKDFEIISGGPMTGTLASAYDVVTKTSNALIVLPPNAYVVEKKKKNIVMDVNRAKSACCQCHMCTDLCPRNLLGHPIEPHAFMNALTNNAASQTKAVIDTLYCCQCGLCEMYACFQSLSPASLIGKCKTELRRNGVAMPQNIEPDPVNSKRELRRVPITRLLARLGLTKYDDPALLSDAEVKVKQVKIMLSQHIGAPANPCVKVGDKVSAGDIIGQYDSAKLGVNIHASISGTVSEVNDKFVTIKA